jgi:hypothetical protein
MLAEIRNQIYEFALCNQIVDLRGTSAPAKLLGLILACKQIYSEARLLFYSGNTFRISYG